MAEVVITRGCQITLTKDIREKLRVRVGDTIIMNTIGDIIMASKKNPDIFDKHDFLPDNFEKILRLIRSSPQARLKRLGVIS